MSVSLLKLQSKFDIYLKKDEQKGYTVKRVKTTISNQRLETPALLNPISFDPFIKERDNIGRLLSSTTIIPVT